MGVEKKALKQIAILDSKDIKMSVENKVIKNGDMIKYNGKKYKVISSHFKECSSTWMSHKYLYTEPKIDGYDWGIKEDLVEKIVPKNNMNDYKYMFKTFKLRTTAPNYAKDMPERKYKKLPSYEWNTYIMVDVDGKEVPFNWKDMQEKKQKKKYVNEHVNRNMWRTRSKKELMNVNCGVPCGKVNDIWVLDLDFYGDEYKEADCIFTKQFGNYEEYIKKNNLYAVRTISGGTHIYFKYNPLMKQTQNSVCNIDTRNTGGYVVSPFTKIGEDRYKILNNGEVKEASE